MTTREEWLAKLDADLVSYVPTVRLADQARETTRIAAQKTAISALSSGDRVALAPYPDGTTVAQVIALGLVRAPSRAAVAKGAEVTKR